MPKVQLERNRFTEQQNMANLRLLFLTAAALTTVTLVIVTTNLFIPLILSVTLYFLLNPIVNLIERQGYPRALGSILATLIFFVPFSLISYSIISLTLRDASSLETNLPLLLTNARDWFYQFEGNLADRFEFISDLNLTQHALGFLGSISTVFLKTSPNIISNTLWSLVLTPILTFFLLNDAVAIRNTTLNLAPNRFFESTYAIAHLIEDRIGAYVIAKIAEALFVGLLTLLGLVFFGFPYSALLALIAGVTNIIPYFGPIIGFAPILLIPLFDPLYSDLFYPALFISLSINIFDFAVLFPVLVSKIIDLHPLFVLFSVLIGSHLGGPLGILVAIPIAAVIKIILLQILGADLK